jgi:RND family efflux transporter MFP subunit
MSLLKKPLIAVIVILLLAFGLGWLLLGKTGRTHTDTAGVAIPPAAATVPVTRSAINSTLTIAGEFLPWQEVELHGKVAGYIRQIRVDIGDRVRTGQTLAVLEVPELNAQAEGAAAGVRHSQDEIEHARNEVSRAEAAHATLHGAWERLHQASQARPGLIAQQELDDAEARDKTSEAQVDAARSALSATGQQLQMSEATRRQATALENYSHITAPFDGLVTWRYADTGALIQAGTSNASSQPVVKLAEVRTLRLRIPVPESAAAGVHIGDKAQVRVLATGQTFTASVSRFTGALDRSTRTMQVEFDIPNADYKLAPGMFADVIFNVQSHPQALTVPVTALRGRSSDGSATALVVGTGNRVEERAVQTGVEDASRVEIVSGLREGEQVISANLSAFRVGDTVHPQPSSVTPAPATGGDR